MPLNRWPGTPSFPATNTSGSWSTPRSLSKSAFRPGTWDTTRDVSLLFLELRLLSPLLHLGTGPVSTTPVAQPRCHSAQDRIGVATVGGLPAHDPVGERAAHGREPEGGLTGADPGRVGHCLRRNARQNSTIKVCHRLLPTRPAILLAPQSRSTRWATLGWPWDRSEQIFEQVGSGDQETDGRANDIAPNRSGVPMRWNGAPRIRPASSASTTHNTTVVPSAELEPPG
jgi:hypothetical protein